jgi:Na+:H+ antiporter, NhaA family
VSADTYASFWDQELDVRIGDAALHLTFRHWLNDALMALFFFVVGLEIERELVTGELQDRRIATRPVVAALGGVALPALIFFAFTAGTAAASGWAIPAATDIAFAVGLWRCWGTACPPESSCSSSRSRSSTTSPRSSSSRSSTQSHSPWAGCSRPSVARGGGRIPAARRLADLRVRSPRHPRMVAVHQSGVHATIAGVALGLLTPTGLFRSRPIMQLLEHRLHIVTAFAIVPLFALRMPA